MWTGGPSLVAQMTMSSPAAMTGWPEDGSTTPHTRLTCPVSAIFFHLSESRSLLNKMSLICTSWMPTVCYTVCYFQIPKHDMSVFDIQCICLVWARSNCYVKILQSAVKCWMLSFDTLKITLYLIQNIFCIIKASQQPGNQNAVYFKRVIIEPSLACDLQVYLTSMGEQPG